MDRRTVTAETPARTLADALRGWDDDALAGLLAVRPDLARPAPTGLGQLATRAGARGSVTRALDELDTAHVAVVEALALLPEPVTAADLERVVRAQPATVAAVLRRLRGLALVWGGDTDLRLVRVAKDVVGPTPAGLGPSLVPLLAATNPARLRALAEDLNVGLGADPQAAATRIAAAYADGAWTRARIDEAAAAAGDEVPRILDRLASGPPAARLGPVPTDVRVATAVGGLQHLVARALVAPVDARTVTLPREIGLQLRGGRTTTEPVDAPPRPATRTVSPRLVDTLGAGTAYETVRRVQLTLETWGASAPGVLRSGGIGVRDVRVLAGNLDVGEDDAGLLLEVTRAAGLLAVGSDAERGQVWLPTEDFDDWRVQPTAARWEGLVTAWLDTARATVLVGGRDERDRPVNPLARDLDRVGSASVRRATLEVLAEAGAAAAVDDVEQVVHAVAWARPRQVGLRDHTVRRTLVEAAALGVTAMGALTSVGRALLNGTDQVGDLLSPLLPRPVDHVLLQADLTAVAPGPLEPAVEHGLALLADVESRGGATVYRFGSDSVRRALDTGWTPGGVHAFLLAHSRTPVPQPLTYLVDDTARRHRQMRVGAGEVDVAVDDPADVLPARPRRGHRAPRFEGPTGETAPATAIVTAMRAGERARAARPAGERVAGAGRLVQELRAAVEDGRTVWLAYLDETGTVSERAVDPVGVGDGRLTAYDHRSARTRGFTLHRISHVAGSG